MIDQSVSILGTGSYAPKEEVLNAEVGRHCGVDAEWIERKTNIVSRRYAAPDEATSDLAARAAQEALNDAGLTADQIDYLIVATSTPDSPQPPTSYLVQNQLDAWNAACLDINVVCSGFVYGLVLARSLIATHPGAKALVVAADVYSRILDRSDRKTAILFGDGAGAVVLAGSPQPGLFAFHLASRGDARGLIRVEAGGSRLPASHETVDDGAHFFKMDGRAVRDFVMDEVPPVLSALCSKAGVYPTEVDHFVPHQANGVMLTGVVELAGLTHATTHRTVEEYGNMGAASVAFALDQANRTNAIADGDLVLLAGFGGGMAVGACLLRWGVPA